jgi:hypothetical protein
MIYILTLLKFSKDGHEIIRSVSEGFHTSPDYFDKVLIELSRDNADGAFDQGWLDHAVVEAIPVGILKRSKVVQWYKLGDNGVERIVPPTGWEKNNLAIYQS